MQKRQTRIGLLILFLFAALSTAVYAQQDPFGMVLRSIERIGGLYETYFYAIDCIMYAVILIGAAQYALSKQFEGPGGKAVIIGVGVSLALAASYFEYKQGASGFRLIGGLAPFAIILTLILFGFCFYKLFTLLGANGRLIGMFMYSLGFFYIVAQFPHIGSWAMTKGGYLAMAWSFLHALAVICFFWALIELVIRLVSGSGLGAAAGATAGAAADAAAGVSDWLRDRRDRRGPPPGGPGPPAPPPSPTVAGPTNVTAAAADRDVVIRWTEPAGGNPTGYVIQRYTRKRRGLKPNGPPININVNTVRVWVDTTPAPGDYVYSVQAVEGANSSRPEDGYTPNVRTNNPKCNYNILGFGGAAPGFIVLLRLTSIGVQRFNAGGNVTLYGISPGFIGVVDFNVPVQNQPAWVWWPIPPNTTTLDGFFIITANEMNALGGGPPVNFVFDTQNVNVA